MPNFFHLFVHGHKLFIDTMDKFGRYKICVEQVSQKVQFNFRIAAGKVCEE